jgi:hypothetical protein
MVVDPRKVMTFFEACACIPISAEIDPGTNQIFFRFRPKMTDIPMFGLRFRFQQRESFHKDAEELRAAKLVSSTRRDVESPVFLLG